MIAGAARRAISWRMSFAGKWSTSFGPMVLTQDGSRVRGTYGREVTEHPIEGTATANEFTFRYTEPQESGTGRFKLKRYGHFSGEYLAEGNYRALPWQGWRGCDGLWDTPARAAAFRRGDAGAHVRLRGIRRDRADRGYARRHAAHLHARGRQLFRPRRRRSRSGRLRLQRRMVRAGPAAARAGGPAHPAAAGADLADRGRGLLAARARRQRVRVRRHAAGAVRAVAARAGAASLLSRRDQPAALVPPAALSAGAVGADARRARRAERPHRQRQDHSAGRAFSRACAMPTASSSCISRHAWSGRTASAR